MSYTNETKKLHLPQWVGTDRPTYLIDFNQAFLNIDNAFIANDIDIESIRAKLNSFVSTMLNNTKDLNDIENGNFSLEENIDFAKQNRPDKRKSYLKSYSDNIGTWQILVTNENNLYIRSKMNGESWSAWTRLISETELKTYMNNIKKDISDVQTKVNNVEIEVNENKEKFDKLKLYSHSFIIDVDATDWASGGNERLKIKANKGQVLKLKPRSVYIKEHWNEFIFVSAREVYAVINKGLSLHGYDFRTTDITNSPPTLSVNNGHDYDIDLTDSETLNIVDGLFIPKEFCVIK